MFIKKDSSALSVRAAALSAVCLLSISQANGDLLVEFSEDANGVSFESSGSFDTTGLTIVPNSFFQAPTGAAISGNSFGVSGSAVAPDLAFFITPTTLPISFTADLSGGGSGIFAALSFNGLGVLLFDSNELSGTILTPGFSGSFGGTSLANIGLEPLLNNGSVVAFTNPMNGDTISYSLSVPDLTAVPEPSGSLFLGILAGISALTTRRRAKS